MSVREMIGRLTEAKTKLAQARQTGAAVAKAVADAREPVDRALDGTPDRNLGDDIARQAEAISTEVAGIDGLIKGVDAAIQRAQGIGRR